MERLWAFVFHNRNLLAALPVVYALLSRRGEVTPGPGLWTLAVLLVGSGILLRGWSFSHCSYRQGPRTHLATTGPYAWSRNPVYVANMAMLSGATVASGLLWLLPVLLVWSFVVFSITIAYEEKRRLHKRYGDPYREYCARVPRWLPGPRLLAAGLPAAGARREVARVSLGQARSLLILLPFVLKQMDFLGLWSAL